MKKETKKAMPEIIEQMLNSIATIILILFLGAIFLGALGFWGIFSFVYSLGIEALIIGGIFIFYIFSVITYFFWDKFAKTKLNIKGAKNGSNTNHRRK